MQRSDDGSGPLLQRDYWGVIRGCRGTPAEVIDALAAHLWDLGAPELVSFRRVDGTCEPLETGDELDVTIHFAGTFGIRILHRDEQSLTIGTREGHPEAGKVTMGAYRNERGDIVFHIRSRARSGSAIQLAGFLAGGEAMQTITWTELVNRVAAAVGEGIIGWIRASTCEVEPERDEDRDRPTFRATGG